jgi:hypothetical protein
MFGSNLPLKFSRWTDDYADQIYNFLLSIFYKAERSRFENYVAVIRMVEIDKGFRIEWAEEFPIESLPNDRMQYVRKRYSEFAKEYTNARCMVLFSVRAAKNEKAYETVIPFDMGEESDLSALQEFADGLEKDEIIKKLNKE